MDSVNSVTNILSRRVAYIAVLLAFIVVILGAYTRLTDAGLGCPDWPGCYGHWRVEANTVAPAKAWAEMIHRYAAGSLGVLILMLNVLAIIQRRHHKSSSLLIPLTLVLLVIFQAALGRWTVTLQLLPVVVMGHLLGGMAILVLLWILALKSGNHLPPISIEDKISDKKFRFWACFGLIIVFLQISLGGWTSTNYAALACADFPFCHGQLFPLQEFSHAFNVFMPLGRNFDGGILDTPARVTIQVVHRLGALVTMLYLLFLGIGIIAGAHQKHLKSIVVIMGVVLALQILLGILNVIWTLPLPVAMLHNACAALLLLSIATLNYALYAKSPHENT